jgi:hypothetical protein
LARTVDGLIDRPLQPVRVLARYLTVAQNPASVVDYPVQLASDHFLVEETFEQANQLLDRTQFWRYPAFGQATEQIAQKALALAGAEAHLHGPVVAVVEVNVQARSDSRSMCQAQGLMVNASEHCKSIVPLRTTDPHTDVSAACTCGTCQTASGKASVANCIPWGFFIRRYIITLVPDFVIGLKAQQTGQIEQQAAIATRIASDRRRD